MINDKLDIIVDDIFIYTQLRHIEILDLEPVSHLFLEGKYHILDPRQVAVSSRSQCTSEFLSKPVAEVSIKPIGGFHSSRFLSFAPPQSVLSFSFPFLSPP